MSVPIQPRDLTEIAVKQARDEVRRNVASINDKALVALADENDRLRAERDAMFRLLTCADTGDECSTYLEAPHLPCAWGSRECWDHRRSAVLAKLRTP